MSDQEPGDDLRIEDLRAPEQPAASAEPQGTAAIPGSFSSLRHASQRAPVPAHRVARLLRLAGVVTLAAVVMLAAIPTLRTGVIGWAQQLLPTPTPTLLPGADRFYLVLTPPGVDVALDGQALARQPLPGDLHPLVLARGRHSIVWRSTHLPFQPLRCVVSVPANTRAVLAHIQSPGECPLDPAFAPSPSGVPATPIGYAIQPPLSWLQALGQDQFPRLIADIQSALDAAPFSTVLQPGEHYALDTPAPHVGIATQPLRATLTYDVLGGWSSEPCAILGFVPCRFPGQDCGSLCTVPAPLADRFGRPGDWIAGLGVRASWTFATQDGRVVAQGIPDPIGAQLLILRISWDGAHWHVAPILGHTTALPATDDAACDGALAQLAGTATWRFMVIDPPPGAYLALASDASPADGCVVVVRNHGVPAPVFLERCGVLLTVNDQARNALDGLPQASLAEQRLAQQLIAAYQI